jgi:hypothetical protein
LVFCFRQWQLKLKPTYYLLGLISLLVVFTLIAATWYGKNLGTYWEFTKFTSSGVLAEVSSLGPVWSPLTWLKYWKVIALWHFGWPVLAATFLSIALWLFVIRPDIKAQLQNWRFFFKKYSGVVLLILLPLPALIATTFSLGKTARYFLPVEFAWLIVIAWVLVSIYSHFLIELKLKNNKIMLLNLGFFGLLISYSFIQSFLVFLPRLPATGYITASAQYLRQDKTEAVYAYLLDYYREKDLGSAKFYMIPEQTRLNDAELIWYFTQNQNSINTLGEFSPQTTIEQAKVKILQADYLIIDSNPELAKTYLPKFKELLDSLTKSAEFEQVSAHDFETGTKLLILKRITK